MFPVCFRRHSTVLRLVLYLPVGRKRRRALCTSIFLHHICNRLLDTLVSSWPSTSPAAFELFAAVRSDAMSAKAFLMNRALCPLWKEVSVLSHTTHLSLVGHSHKIPAQHPATAPSTHCWYRNTQSTNKLFDQSQYSRSRYTRDRVKTSNNKT